MRHPTACVLAMAVLSVLCAHAAETRCVWKADSSDDDGELVQLLARCNGSLVVDGVTDDNASVLWQHLALHAGPRRLAFTNNDGITADTAMTLARILSLRQSNLEVLDLSYATHMGIEGVGAFALHLLENTRLQKLSLYGCKFQPDALRVLAEALMINRSLRVLNLGLNAVRNEGADYLADLLSGGSALTHLYLFKAFIGSQGIATLAEGIAKTTALQELVLDSNVVNPAVAGILASALRQNRSLRRLSMLGVDITANAAIALAPAFAEGGSTVQELDLSRNTMGDEGAVHIARALQSNTALVKLDLNLVGITDVAALALAEAVRQHPTLQEMALRQNKISDAAVDAFTRLLQQSNALMKLDLRKTTLTADAAQQLAAIAKARGKTVLVESDDDGVGVGRATNNNVGPSVLPQQPGPSAGDEL